MTYFFKNIFRNKYRIYKDKTYGYTVEMKKWYYLFWTNKFDDHNISWNSVESAEEYARRYESRINKRIVKYLGVIDE